MIFLFVPCGRLSWLHVRFLLHVKYTLSYTYRIALHAANTLLSRFYLYQSPDMTSFAVLYLTVTISTQFIWWKVCVYIGKLFCSCFSTRLVHSLAQWSSSSSLRTHVLLYSPDVSIILPATRLLPVIIETVRLVIHI